MKITVNKCAEVFDFLAQNDVEFCMLDGGKGQTIEDINQNAVKLVSVLINGKKLPELLNVITGEEYDGDTDLEEATKVVLDFFVAYRQQSTGLALAMMLPNPQPAGKEEIPSGNTRNT